MIGLKKLLAMLGMVALFGSVALTGGAAAPVASAHSASASSASPTATMPAYPPESGPVGTVTPSAYCPQGELEVNEPNGGKCYVASAVSATAATPGSIVVPPTIGLAPTPPVTSGGATAAQLGCPPGTPVVRTEGVSYCFVVSNGGDTATLESSLGTAYVWHAWPDEPALTAPPALAVSPSGDYLAFVVGYTLTWIPTGPGALGPYHGHATLGEYIPGGVTTAFWRIHADGNGDGLVREFVCSRAAAAADAAGLGPAGTVYCYDPVNGLIVDFGGQWAFPGI
jgi:hypothetical protein